MDLQNGDKKNKKRVLMTSNSDLEDTNSNPKRASSSNPSGFEAADEFFAGFLSQIKPVLNNLVEAEVKKVFEALFPHLESLREKLKGKEDGVIIESEIEKFKLVFCNEIIPIIFTNSEISGENGEPLQVAICDKNTNTIISTGVISTAQIEFFVLDGEYGSEDFDKNILSPRDGKRPLLVGNDKKLTLSEGIGVVKMLSITDNSSWMKSKKFRMGAKIIDPNILSMFPNIGAAVSQPFRAMDHRGEVNKKHHPPSSEDEVWRLEGIGKDGAYHKNLSFHGIRNVGDFLQAYREMGSIHLRKLLGIKVPKKTWMMMVENAFEIISTRPPYQQNSKDNYLGKEVMRVDEEAFTDQNANLNNFEYPMPSFVGDQPTFYYEAYPGEASTSFETLTPNTIKDFGSN